MKKNKYNYWLIGTGLVIDFIVLKTLRSMWLDCPTCLGMFGIFLLPVLAIGILLIIRGFSRKKPPFNF